jgi:Polyketide cyclase / dehydrase and lipid transport
LARYVTTIRSRLSAEEAFDYMADFTNARSWDPSVSAAERDGEGFRLVSRFAGRDVTLRYEIVTLDRPHLVVFEARQPSFVSRDTISVEPDGRGSTVHYDARLEFSGARRALGPLMQLAFNRVGAQAAAGMTAALNP